MNSTDHDDSRADAEFALIVQQDGAQQRSLMRSTPLVFNYQYGLDILVAHDLARAAALCLDHRRKVGCISQQIALINSLVKPEESAFYLRRFWGHSVGTAVIADKLYTEGMISLGTELNDYWIGSLMHDIGKFILCFFFWD